MRNIIRPFRENIPAGQCDLCGEIIYVGDVAYRFYDECFCVGCVDRSAYVAREESFFEESRGEHLFVDADIRKEGSN